MRRVNRGCGAITRPTGVAEVTKHILIVRVGEDATIENEKRVFSWSGDGRYLSEVDRPEDEGERVLKVVKETENVGVLLGMCSTMASETLASVSSAIQAGGWAAGQGAHF